MEWILLGKVSGAGWNGILKRIFHPNDMHYQMYQLQELQMARQFKSDLEWLPSPNGH